MLLAAAVAIVATVATSAIATTSVSSGSVAAQAATENAATAGSSSTSASSTSGGAVVTGDISGVEKIYVSVVSTTPQTSDDVNPAVSQSQAQTLVSALNSYWSTQSNGEVTIEFGGFETVSLGESTCDPNAALSSEESSAFGGMFAHSAWKGTHTHLLVLSAESCDADSFATVGGTGGEIFSGNGISTTVGVPYLLHEFGHNLGFEHADASICTNTSSYDGKTSDFSFTSSVCPTREYDDYFDIMGYTVKGATPNLSTPQRIMAGWLTNYSTVNSSTTQTVSALGSSGGIQALKIVDQSSGDIYYVEYRTNAGLDATSAEFHYGLQCDPAMSGYTICELDTVASQGAVRVLRVIPFASANANGTTVMAAALTAGSSDKTKRHTHLNTGDSFTSADGAFSLTVNSTNPSSGASISVSFAGSGTPATATPTPTPTATSTTPQSVTPAPVVRVPSSIAIRLSRSTVRHGSRDSVRLTVHLSGVARPTGTVTLYLNGVAVRSYALTARNRGVIRATLPRLTTVGYNSVTAVYSGPGNALADSASGVTVR
jgi:Bacterial Ig-like domain (group 3)